MQLHTDDPAARLAAGSVLPTEAPSGSGVPRALTVRSARAHRGIWLVAFEEVPDRTGAESLRGTRLLLPEAGASATTQDGADGADGAVTPDGATPDPAEDDEAGLDGAGLDGAEEDAWYEDQLVGLRVLSPDGTVLGVVSGLEIGAAQDLLVVTLLDGTVAHIPFVSALVPTVDVDGGRIVVDPPPGLLDLNA